MNEHLLQFIWQFQYFNKSELATTGGDPIRIITPGSLNTQQGPDFSGARIRIGSAVWAGSVELHIRTSDWFSHDHGTDSNYKNVILHVVYENDMASFSLPVLELKSRIATSLLHRYRTLMQSQQFIACEKLIADVPRLTMVACKERMVIERLQRKVAHIEMYLKQTGRHWEEAFWRLLARNFGGKTNAEAFENIAQHLPVRILAKHKNQLIQLEALLLGVAGLLEYESFEEKYCVLLQREYRFLKNKYQLKAIVYPVYFLRMRPANFPTLRLAQLAALIHGSAHLFSKIIEEPSLKRVESWFEAEPNDYWSYHYTLKDEPVERKKSVGRDMINNIMINTVVPLLFAYGIAQQNETLKRRSLAWLDEIKAERNLITSGFESLHIANKSAWDSQALTELKTQYCDRKRCLQCSVGNAVLKH